MRSTAATRLFETTQRQSRLSLRERTYFRGAKGDYISKLFLSNPLAGLTESVVAEAALGLLVLRLRDAIDRLNPNILADAEKLAEEAA